MFYNSSFRILHTISFLSLSLFFVSFLRLIHTSCPLSLSAMLTLYGDGEGNLEMDESAFIGYEVLHAVAYTENTANTGEGFHPERTVYFHSFLTNQNCHLYLASSYKCLVQTNIKEMEIHRNR